MNKNLEKIIELNSKLTHLKQKIKELDGIFGGDLQKIEENPINQKNSKIKLEIHIKKNEGILMKYFYITNLLGINELELIKLYHERLSIEIQDTEKELNSLIK